MHHMGSILCMVAVLSIATAGLDFSVAHAGDSEAAQAVQQECRAIAHVTASPYGSQAHLGACIKLSQLQVQPVLISMLSAACVRFVSFRV